MDTCTVCVYSLITMCVAMYDIAINLAAHIANISIYESSL